MKLGKNWRIGGGGDPWHYEMREAMGGSRPRRLTASLLTRGTAPEGPVGKLPVVACEYDLVPAFCQVTAGPRKL